MQGAAARQLDSRLLEGFVQRVDIRAQGVLIVVAVEENVELVARDARADRARGRILGKAEPRLADVFVAPVVAEGVVRVLEPVEVEHQQRRVAELLRLAEEVAANALEGSAVVEPCERIIIAFMLDTQPLQGGGCHILGKADLRVVLVCRFDADVAL